MRHFTEAARPAPSGPSQAEPLGDTATPGVLALPLLLLLQEFLVDVLVRRVAFGAQLFLRKEIWEREGLSMRLRRRRAVQEPAPAASAAIDVDGTCPPSPIHLPRARLPCWAPSTDTGLLCPQVMSLPGKRSTWDGQALAFVWRRDWVSESLRQCPPQWHCLSRGVCGRPGGAGLE